MSKSMDVYQQAAAVEANEAFWFRQERGPQLCAGCGSRLPWFDWRKNGGRNFCTTFCRDRMAAKTTGRGRRRNG